MASLSGLQPWLRPYAEGLYDLARQYSMQPRITSVFRSHGEQQRLYDRYRQGLSDLPAAPPGKSQHQYGLAFDMVVREPTDQAWLGQVWNAWGGRWVAGDRVHFGS